MITDSQLSGIFGITATTVNIMQFVKAYFERLDIHDMGFSQQGDCLHYDIRRGDLSKITKSDLPSGWDFKLGLSYKGTKSETKIVCFYEAKAKQYIKEYGITWDM
jgi:hypothetical protein